MAIPAIAAAVAAKKAIERVVDVTYELGKAQFGRQIQHWKAKSKIDGIYKKIKNVRKVKTIWQVEKEIDLSQFYYPSKVRIGDKRKTIDDLSDFDYDGNIVVRGTIGRGKSIFFRFLTSQELLKGKAIPLFVELRRVKKDQTLSAQLLQELKSLGLEMNEETLLFLAKAGKIILFLDAFDEVKESQRSDLISEIEHFAKSYESLRMLISSRPNSGIEASPFFRVFELCGLENNEYEQVIAKMAHDEKTASEIVKGVRRAEGRIAQLLTTPLMVALLMLRYRVDQSIPENAIAFYGDLFNLLLLRHDKTKAGYVRTRKSQVGDAALLEIFNGICYLTRKGGQGAFTLNELHKYAKDAVTIADQRCSADKVVADIIEITCLIIEEGGECKFIHRSLQEYHAACFIKEQPDDSVAKFYKAARSFFQPWEQELEFLSMIDKYRFFKFFLIPDIHAALGLGYEPVPIQWEPSRSQVATLIQGVSIGFNKATQRKINLVSTIYEPRHGWSLVRIARPKFAHALFNLDYSSLTNELRRKDSPLQAKVVRERPHGERADYDYEIKVSDVLESGLMASDICGVAGGALQLLHKELLESRRSVEHVEATKSIFDF